MEEFTLFELGIEELSLTNTAPMIGRGGDRSGAGGSTAAEPVADGDRDDDEGGPSGGGLRRFLIALALLALLVAVAVAMALSGDDELDDLAALDEESDA